MSGDAAQQVPTPHPHLLLGCKVLRRLIIYLARTFCLFPSCSELGLASSAPSTLFIQPNQVCTTTVARGGTSLPPGTTSAQPSYNRPSKSALNSQPPTVHFLISPRLPRLPGGGRALETDWCRRQQPFPPPVSCLVRRSRFLNGGGGYQYLHSAVSWPSQGSSLPFPTSLLSPFTATNHLAHPLFFLQITI